MKKIIVAYFISALIFLMLDTLWLGVIARSFYAENLGPVIPIQFSVSPAAVFYAFYIAGILYFAIWPAFTVDCPKDALVNGALLGGLCYATYDLTSMAVIPGWPLIVTVVDIIWGMVITGVTSYLSWLVLKRLLNIQADTK